MDQMSGEVVGKNDDRVVSIAFLVGGVADTLTISASLRPAFRSSSCVAE